MLRTFCQQNYPGLMLGKTNIPFVKYGCTTDGITMGFNWLYNTAWTPNIITGKLNYTPSGKIIWESLKNINLKLVARMDHRDDIAINAALQNPTQFCLLEVNGGAHWLFLIGRKLPILGYKVVDPWTGKVCYTNKYNNNITGCAIITKA